ncbi:MAG: flagellar hook-basal body complex protein FliE [Ruminiclostridium sp.]|nr:flagellar hook-basal body complex protein FliE [Ruminiclostridium sp.]
MQIIPMSPSIHTIAAADRLFGNGAVAETAGKTEEEGLSTGTFLDALTGLWDQAAEAQAQKNEDMMNVLLGDTESLEQLQINIAKAEISTELLVNIKNAVVDAYNEIMRMSI